MVTQIESTVSPRAFALRLEYLLDNSEYNAQELSLAIGKHKGRVSQLLAAARETRPENAPKTVGGTTAWILATALAGSKRIIDDQQAVFMFLLSGVGSETVVRPTTGMGDPFGDGGGKPQGPEATVSYPLTAVSGF